MSGNALRENGVGSVPDVADDSSVSVDRVELSISRPVYNQIEFDDLHESKITKQSIRDRLDRTRSRIKCSGDRVKRTLIGHLPFIHVLRHYDVKQDLLSDVIAGLTVGIMHIPQGMAYGFLATLPPIYGLYVSFFPAIIYFFLGTSRQLSLGTFALVSIMVGTTLEKVNCDYEQVTNQNNLTVVGNYSMTRALSINQTDGLTDVEDVRKVMCKVGYATALAFVTGIIQFCMGLCQLGFVTVYMSEPLTRGLTTGAAIHVFTSQIKHIFGIRLKTYQGPLKLIYTYIDFFSKITETNVSALVMSIICILVLVLVKELANPKVKKAIKMPIPTEIILVILATITSYYWGMEEKFGTSVVGDIPTGIPAPTFPAVNKVTTILADSFSIALVAFAINISIGKLFAKKNNYEIDTNQELYALALCNIIGSMFNCFPCGASMSRSSVQEGVGGKTQVVGIISSALLLLVLFAIGPLFEELPKCVLAAIIIVNLKGLYLQFNDLAHLWKISIYDFLTWLVVFIAVILMNIDIGLAIGVAFSLLTVVCRTQRPNAIALGHVQSTNMYAGVKHFQKANELPGIKIFKFESSLYFANAEYFIQRLFKLTVNPRKIKAALKRNEKDSRNVNKTQTKCCITNRKTHTMEQKPMKIQLDVISPEVTDVIIDCTTMAYVDYVGANTLKQVIGEYRDSGINVSLVGCSAGIRTMLEAVCFYKDIPRDILYITMHDAVLMAKQRNSVSTEKAFSTHL